MTRPPIDVGAAAAIAPERIVSEARSWLGTPYRHQASLRGTGCDCLGLLRGVWREVIGPEPARAPAYAPDWAEAGGAEALLDAAMRHLAGGTGQGAGEVFSGAVVLFRWGAGHPAKHVGIVSCAGDAARFIHAWEGRAVTETRLTPWWGRRVAGVFALPGTAVSAAFERGDD